MRGTRVDLLVERNWACVRLEHRARRHAYEFGLLQGLLEGVNTLKGSSTSKEVDCGLWEVDCRWKTGPI